MPEVRTDDGVRLHYVDEGHGPPVVFLHGWTMSGRFFEAQVERLSRDRRCVVPDLRGHGASEARPGTHTMDRFADDVRDLLGHLRLEHVALVGWSMGGGVAMRYLDRYGPARVRTLGLVDFPPKFEEEPSVAEKVCARLRTDRDRFITAFLRRMFHAEPTPEAMAWMKQEHFRCAPETACESYRQLGVGDALGRTYTLPAFLAFPTHGWYRSAVEDWCRIFPRHEAPAFERSRHCPFLEEADAFADAFRRLSG